MIITKRNGTKTKFNKDKIEQAILKAMTNGSGIVKKDIALKIANECQKIVLLLNDSDERLSVKWIEDYVYAALIELGQIETAKKYEGYRAVQEFKRNMDLRNETNRILHETTRENANKNSYLISTKKGLTLDAYMTNEMLNHDLPKHLAKAHKDNDIKFHDVSDRKFGSINCCLFDMKNVIDNNPTINGLKYDQAESVEAYLGVLSDVLLEASSCQYGGFTIPEIDYVLEESLEKAYKKSVEYYSKELGSLVPTDKINELAFKFVERAFRKRWNGIETRLNSISNSNMQVPFETISLGNRTGFWARMATKIILETRLKGCGKHKQTAVFPKIVFYYRDEIHGEGGINEDLYKLAIKVRSKRAYPDMLSLDEGYCGDIWKKYGYALPPMGL